MNKKIFFEYLRTFFLTIIAAFVTVVLIVVLMMQQISSESHIKEQAENDTLDLSMIEVLIEKNKYLLEQHPENYKIDSKLGFLYETKKDYKNAELEYKAALSKVPYYEYKPYYDLALLYVKLGRLEEAQALMDNLGEKPSKKLIKYKAEVYSKLGDKYYDKADYEEASFKYIKALDYYEVIKSNEKEKQLQSSLASSYVYLADQKIAEMKIDEAIIYINKARLVIKAPILTYKLGLLLSQTNPELASQCFDEVFKQEPTLINYEEYYNLLNKLARNAEYEDNPAKTALYEYKIKKIKKYYNENILSVYDIQISDEVGKFSLNKLFRNYKVSISLALKNTSKYDIDSLFLEVVFKDEGEVIDRYSKQIVEKISPLKTGEKFPLLYVQTKKIQVTDQFPKEVTVEIYASKNQDSRKLLLDKLIVKPEVKKANKTKNWLDEFYLKHILPYIGS